ncbi:MAG: trypsin-like peptidase domain-containing protein [Gloeotrichia echinulata HAB0833]
MNFSTKFNPILVGTAIIALVQPQIVFALTAPEVNAIAKQILVRIDGAKTGSGVIVDHQGSTYTVLTNWHVLEEMGTYNINTQDGKIYQIDASKVRRIPGVDLAEVQFTSKQDYKPAKLCDSGGVTEGMTVYVAGWADPDAFSNKSSYTFLDGRISRIVPSPLNGYGLVYSNPAKVGTSGGPVLDEQGCVIGINGQAKFNPITKVTEFSGIPINLYNPLVKTLTGHNNWVDTLAISRDGKILVSGSADNTIKIWQLPTGNLIRTLTGHSNSRSWNANNRGIC